MISDSINNAKLIAQQSILRDSINQLNIKLHHEPITGLDVLNNVNTFYNSAWGNLIWVVGIILGIGGVVLPILIQLWQKRTLKLNEDELRKEITLAVNSAKDELKDTINKSIIETKKEIDISISESINLSKIEIDDIIENVKSEILENAKKQIEEKITNLDIESQKITNSLMGRTLQLQAKTLTEYPYKALRSNLQAVQYYSKSVDYEVGRNLLRTIIAPDSPMRKMKKIGIDTDFKISRNTFLGLIKKIAANNTFIDYTEYTEKIIDIYNDLPEN